MERHTPSRNRFSRRERIHNNRKASPKQQHNIRKEAKRAHPKGAMGDIVAASDEEANDRDGIRDVEQDDASRDHAIERGIAAQIQETEDGDNEAADEMRTEGDVHARVDVAEEFRKGETAVAGEGPAEAALPCVARDETPDACCYEEAFEDDGCGFATEGLVEECEDGDEGGGRLEVIEVVHAEEEGDGVEP